MKFACCLSIAAALLISVSVNPIPVLSVLSADDAVCSTPSRSPAELAESEARFKLSLESSRSFSPFEKCKLRIDIPVVFHILYNGPDYVNGNLSDSDVHAQITVLNNRFSNTQFRFYLANLTRTFSDQFFRFAHVGNDNQGYMKAALRQGNEATLNIYTVAFKKKPTLNGYSTFPDSFATRPVDDGVVILYKTLPGGSQPIHNLGAIAVHETGHWLGLYHTFQGGCDGDGDFVDDTPPEDGPSYACDERDSCTNDTLPDPIHNLMDYSEDACRSDPFTPGQVTRMSQQWSAFRAKNAYPKGSQADTATIPNVDPGSHSECDFGMILKPQCSPCVAKVVGALRSCGDVLWDFDCVDLAKSLCGLTCE
ncbi:hypothetical protein BJ742DRAFT_833249 [Cladochytrium replicatum]|nr:hypothetical protein BJ742DRAFT_833249 [Cladochytrium replicatum]